MRDATIAGKYDIVIMFEFGVMAEPKFPLPFHASSAEGDT
jgi:hypothetical protein